MATFGGTAADVHSNEAFNNGFYNPDVYGNFHFQQNNDCAQEPRQNFQNFPVPLSPPLPHPHPPVSYPFPGPYSGYESGLAPSCPQLVEEKLLSNDERLPAARSQDDLHAYPAYPHRFAEPRNSSLLPAPVLPLRFSASRKNFPPDSEQQSASPSNNNNYNNNNSNNNINNINSSNNNNSNNNNNNNSSFQIQYPVPSFQGVPGQYGYGPQYLSMPHLYARPPPLSPYHQHPTGWTTPLPPHQHQSPATTTTEGPYLQNNHQSLLKVSPSMYYSQDFAASHPNAAPVRFRASVEYPETSGWNRKDDGEGQEEEEAKEEEKERKIQRRIPANNARKIVYGLDPLPRQMIMQASSSSSSSAAAAAAAATDSQEQPKTTNAIALVPNGTQYVLVPNGTQYAPVPNGTQYAPVPNGTQYAPVPNGTQYAPVPNGTQYAPVPNGTQYAPVPNGTQYAPVPNGTQYAPVPNGTQYMPAPYGTQYMPVPNGTPHMPVPNGTPYMPAPNGTPYMSVPNGTPYMSVPNGPPYMPVPNGSQYAPVPYGTPYMPVPNGASCLPRSQEPRLETINENGPVIRQQQGQEPPDGRAVTNASGSGAGEAVKGINPESEKALDEGPKIDFTPAKVVSCLVIVFCGGLLWGVLGFIFAVEGQTRYLKGDRKKALKLKGLSYLMSIVGVVCGMLAAIIVGVLFGVYRT